MTPSDLLRQALQQAHVYLEIKRRLCPESRLYEALPGATIGPIGAIYAHAVVNEDAYVQRDRKGEARFSNGRNGPRNWPSHRRWRSTLSGRRRFAQI